MIGAGYLWVNQTNLDSDIDARHRGSEFIVFLILIGNIFPNVNFIWDFNRFGTLCNYNSSYSDFIIGKQKLVIIQLSMDACIGKVIN